MQTESKLGAAKPGDAIPLSCKAFFASLTVGKNAISEEIDVHRHTIENTLMWGFQASARAVRTPDMMMLTDYSL